MMKKNKKKKALAEQRKQERAEVERLFSLDSPDAVEPVWTECEEYTQPAWMQSYLNLLCGLPTDKDEDDDEGWDWYNDCDNDLCEEYTD